MPEEDSAIDLKIIDWIGHGKKFETWADLLVKVTDIEEYNRQSLLKRVDGYARSGLTVEQIGQELLGGNSEDALALKKELRKAREEVLQLKEKMSKGGRAKAGKLHGGYDPQDVRVYYEERIAEGLTKTRALERTAKHFGVKSTQTIRKHLNLSN